MQKPETTTNVHFDILANPAKMDGAIKHSPIREEQPDNLNDDLKISVSSVGSPQSKHSLHNSHSSSDSEILEKSNSNTKEEKHDWYSTLNESQKRLARLKVLGELQQLKLNYQVHLSREYHVNSDYYEMTTERDYHMNSKRKLDSVEMAKNFLVLSVQGLEYFNNRFNPFSLRLENWSKSFELQKHEYTEVLCELYDKYVSTGKTMPPEIRLVFMIGTSAMMYHATNILMGERSVEQKLQDPNVRNYLRNVFANQNPQQNVQPQQPQQPIQQQPVQNQPVRLDLPDTSFIGSLKRNNDTVTSDTMTNTATGSSRKKKNRVVNLNI